MTFEELKEYIKRKYEANEYYETSYVKLPEILKESSYLFYELEDSTEEIEYDNEDSIYTKYISPLNYEAVINDDSNTELLDIITEEIPFYHLISDKVPSGTEDVLLSETRDIGTNDVPSLLQESNFYEHWIRHSFGYVQNLILLDAYNKLRYPYINENQYLDAKIFPKLAKKAFDTSEIAEARISFKDTEEKNNEVYDKNYEYFGEEVGCLDYIDGIIENKLKSAYSYIDYDSEQSNFLVNLLDSLYQSGQINNSEKTSEKLIFKLQEIKNEYLRRKLSGTYALYKLALSSINRKGSYIGIVKAGDVDVKSTIISNNDKRPVRIVNVPGLTTEFIENFDYTIDPISVFYTKNEDDDKIPLNILTPIYYTSSTVRNPSSMLEKIAYNNEAFYTLGTTDVEDIHKYIKYDRFINVKEYESKFLRDNTNIIPWNELQSVISQNNLIEYNDTLDMTADDENEGTTKLRRLDSYYINDYNEKIQYHLDRTKSIIDLRTVYSNVLDINADHLIFSQNTLQKNLGDSYEYLTYPIADGNSVSLMDVSWLNYIEYQLDNKTKVTDTTSFGTQINKFINLEQNKFTSYEFFGVSYSDDETDTIRTIDEFSSLSDIKYMLLWYCSVIYDVIEFKVKRVEKKLISRITLKSNAPDDFYEISSGTGVERKLKSEYEDCEEFTKYNIGVLPFTYKNLVNQTILDLKLGFYKKDGKDVYYNDAITQGYSTSMFVFSKYDINKSSKGRNVDPDSKEINSSKEGEFNSEVFSKEIIRDIKSIYYSIKKTKKEEYRYTTEEGNWYRDEDGNLVSSNYVDYFAWSDPINVVQLSNEYLDSFENNRFIPDWTGLSYHLNPYMNLTTESASSLRSKDAIKAYNSLLLTITGQLSDKLNFKGNLKFESDLPAIGNVRDCYFIEETTEYKVCDFNYNWITLDNTIITHGPSNNAGISNLARLRRLDFACNDNGEKAPTNWVNPLIYPDYDSEVEDKNQSIYGLFLEHTQPSIINRYIDYCNYTNIYGDNRQSDIFDLPYNKIEFYYGDGPEVFPEGQLDVLYVLKKVSGEIIELKYYIFDLLKQDFKEIYFEETIKRSDNYINDKLTMNALSLRKSNNLDTADKYYNNYLQIVPCRSEYITEDNKSTIFDNWYWNTESDGITICLDAIFNIDSNYSYASGIFIPTVKYFTLEADSTFAEYRPTYYPKAITESDVFVKEYEASSGKAKAGKNYYERLGSGSNIDPYYYVYKYVEEGKSVVGLYEETGSYKQAEGYYSPNVNYYKSGMLYSVEPCYFGYNVKEVEVNTIYEFVGGAYKETSDTRFDPEKTYHMYDYKQADIESKLIGTEIPAWFKKVGDTYVQLEHDTFKVGTYYTCDTTVYPTKYNEVNITSTDSRIGKDIPAYYTKIDNKYSLITGQFALGNTYYTSTGYKEYYVVNLYGSVIPENSVYTMNLIEDKFIIGREGNGTGINSEFSLKLISVKNKNSYKIRFNFYPTGSKDTIWKLDSKEFAIGESSDRNYRIAASIIATEFNSSIKTNKVVMSVIVNDDVEYTEFYMDHSGNSYILDEDDNLIPEPSKEHSYSESSTSTYKYIRYRSGINEEFIAGKPIKYFIPNVAKREINNLGTIDLFTTLVYNEDGTITQTENLYGDIFDLRLYNSGRNTNELKLLNMGSNRELFSYSPSIYKLAYNTYKDNGIFKIVDNELDNTDIKHVGSIRVFNRSIWDSILIDNFPVSKEEMDPIYPQYYKYFKNPRYDRDVYAYSKNLYNNKEYYLNDCIEQTLLDKIEVFNGRQINQNTYIVYNNEEYNLNTEDKLTAVLSMIQPVDYKDESITTENLKLSLSDNTIISSTYLGVPDTEDIKIYLKQDASDDYFKYSSDICPNFKISSDFDMSTWLSRGNNISLIYNDKVDSTYVTVTDNSIRNSNNNLIVVPLVIPKQENKYSYDMTGYLDRFNISNITLSDYFIKMLRATTYYSELRIPVPCKEKISDFSVYGNVSLYGKKIDDSNCYIYDSSMYEYKQATGYYTKGTIYFNPIYKVTISKPMLYKCYGTIVGDFPETIRYKDTTITAKFYTYNSELKVYEAVTTATPIANKIYYFSVNYYDTSLGETDPYVYGELQVKDDYGKAIPALWTDDFKLTSDTKFMSGKNYYTRMGKGTKVNPYEYSLYTGYTVGDTITIVVYEKNGFIRAEGVFVPSHTYYKDKEGLYIYTDWEAYSEIPAYYTYNLSEDKYELVEGIFDKNTIYFVYSPKNKASFYDKWDGIRFLKEGTYYFTCKYPMKLIPFEDSDFDAKTNNSFVTLYGSTRFKIEVNGNEKDITADEESKYKINGIPVKYLSENIINTLTSASELVNPEDNKRFPHRLMNIKLYALDTVDGNSGLAGYMSDDYVRATETSPVEGRVYYECIDNVYIEITEVKDTDNPNLNGWYYKNGEYVERYDFTWKLIGSNDTSDCYNTKFFETSDIERDVNKYYFKYSTETQSFVIDTSSESVRGLYECTLDKNSIVYLNSETLNSGCVITSEIPMFFSKNYTQPFFVSGQVKSEKEEDYKYSPTSADDDLIEPIKIKIGKADNINISSLDDLDNIVLTAGKSYRIIFDYTSKISEFSYTNEIFELNTDSSISSDEKKNYARLYNLIDSTTKVLDSDYEYITNGESFVLTSKYSDKTCGYSVNNIFNELTNVKYGEPIISEVYTKDGDKYILSEGRYIPGVIYYERTSSWSDIYDDDTSFGNPYKKKASENLLLSMLKTNNYVCENNIINSYKIYYKSKLAETVSDINVARPRLENMTCYRNTSGVVINNIDFNEVNIVKQQYKNIIENDMLGNLQSISTGIISGFSKISPNINYRFDNDPMEIVNESAWSKYINVSHDTHGLYSYQSSSFLLPYSNNIEVVRGSLFKNNLIKGKQQNYLDSTYWTIVGSYNKIAEVEDSDFDRNVFKVSQMNRLEMLYDAGDYVVTSEYEVALNIKCSDINKLSSIKVYYYDIDNNVVEEFKDGLEMYIDENSTGPIYNYHAETGVNITACKIKFVIETEATVDLYLGKVIIRCATQDKHTLGLSNCYYHTSYDDNNIAVASYLIPVLQDNSTSQFIPIQFKNRTISAYGINRPNSGLNCASDFISRNTIGLVEKGGKIKKLNAPWIRRFYYYHSYDDSENVAGTSVQFHKYEVRKDSNGEKYIKEIYSNSNDLYYLTKDENGNTYPERCFYCGRDESEDYFTFKIGNYYSNKYYGISVDLDDDGGMSYFGNNMILDKDNPVSFINETVSMTYNCFNLDNYRNNISSPVAVTNIQILNDQLESTTGSYDDREILYELEYLPIVYDELKHHISINLLIKR